jgi:diguanylate cyclase (GGDEF)-like protein
VLQKLADILKASIRDSDTAARYGGEEFAVILPKVLAEQAFTMAQRIRKQVKIKSASLVRDKAPLTISVGVAEYPKDAKRRLDLIKRADKALYEAKRLGKDQVVQFHDLKRPGVV